MDKENLNEFEHVLLTCMKEILISNNKILLQLNMMQSNKKADKEEIKKAAEKNADKIISQIINKIQSDNGMSEEEYQWQTDDSLEETEKAREEAENNNIKLTDVEDLYGDE